MKINGAKEKVSIFTHASTLSNIFMPGEYVSNISLLCAPKFQRRRCDKNTRTLLGTIVYEMAFKFCVVLT